MSRILGIDYGGKRTGLAVTDLTRIIASPLVTVPTAEIWVYLKQYCATEPVSAFVVGWPLGLDGRATDNTVPVENFCTELAKRFPEKPIYRQNERFTSKEAKEAIILSGIPKKKRQDKSLVDRIAAALILRYFMEDNPQLL